MRYSDAPIRDRIKSNTVGALFLGGAFWRSRCQIQVAANTKLSKSWFVINPCGHARILVLI